MQKLQTKVREILEEIIGDGDIHIVDIEVRRQNKLIICRIYLDTVSGITIGECHRIGKQLNSAIELAGGLGAEYALEVSSPGIERPFSEEWQFRKNVGRLASITYRNQEDQVTDVAGLLQGIQDGRIKMRLSVKKPLDEFIEIPLERILQGKLLVK